LLFINFRKEEKKLFELSKERKDLNKKYKELTLLDKLEEQQQITKDLKKNKKFLKTWIRINKEERFEDNQDVAEKEKYEKEKEILVKSTNRNIKLYLLI
jgi:hypothetical protein